MLFLSVSCSLESDACNCRLTCRSNSVNWSYGWSIAEESDIKQINSLFCSAHLMTKHNTTKHALTVGRRRIIPRPVAASECVEVLARIGFRVDAVGQGVVQLSRTKTCQMKHFACQKHSKRIIFASCYGFVMTGSAVVWIGGGFLLNNRRDFVRILAISQVQRQEDDCYRKRVGICISTRTNRFNAVSSTFAGFLKSFETWPNSANGTRAQSSTLRQLPKTPQMPPRLVWTIAICKRMIREHIENVRQKRLLFSMKKVERRRLEDHK